jgi:hypothetical protein
MVNMQKLRSLMKRIPNWAPAALEQEVLPPASGRRIVGGGGPAELIILTGIISVLIENLPPLGS